MHAVFISYSSHDANEAEALRIVLEKNNIPCWMAPRDIPIGSNYAKEIPVAIRNCRIFLLMLSAHSQDSVWVRKELDTAINCRKVIFPFAMEDCQLNDEFDFLLNGVQRWNAYQKKSQAMEDLIRQIRAIIGADAPQPVEAAKLSPEPPLSEDTSEDIAAESPSPKFPPCPVCGSDQVISQNKIRRAGRAAGGGAALLALAPFGLLGLGAGALAAAMGAHNLLCPTEFRCKSCGHKFTYDRTDENNEPDSELSDLS